MTFDVKLWSGLMWFGIPSGSGFFCWIYWTFWFYGELDCLSAFWHVKDCALELITYELCTACNFTNIERVVFKLWRQKTSSREWSCHSCKRNWLFMVLIATDYTCASSAVASTYNQCDCWKELTAIPSDASNMHWTFPDFLWFMLRPVTLYFLSSCINNPY
jgi:hypothetical protein